MQHFSDDVLEPVNIPSLRNSYRLPANASLYFELIYTTRYHLQKEHHLHCSDQDNSKIGFTFSFFYFVMYLYLIFDLHYKSFNRSIDFISARCSVPHVIESILTNKKRDFSFANVLCTDTTNSKSLFYEITF